MSRSGARQPIKKRVILPKDVNGLPLTVLKNRIKWFGKVRLHLLDEDDEALLSEVEWPKKSGILWYVCVFSGLLFDKQTGKCRQSTNVTLMLETLSGSESLPAGYFNRWRRERKEREKFDWSSMKWVSDFEDEDDGDAEME